MKSTPMLAIALGVLSAAAAFCQIQPPAGLRSGPGVQAAQDDIEPVAKAVFRDGRFPVEQGDQPFSRCLASDTVEYWIKRQERVAREIHLSDQAGSKGRPENREMDMCWTPGIVMVAPRVFARTNGFESKAAL